MKLWTERAVKDCGRRPTGLCVWLQRSMPCGFVFEQC